MGVRFINSLALSLFPLFLKKGGYWEGLIILAKGGWVEKYQDCVNINTTPVMSTPNATTSAI